MFLMDLCTAGDSSQGNSNQPGDWGPEEYFTLEDAIIIARFIGIDNAVVWHWKKLIRYRVVFPIHVSVQITADI